MASAALATAPAPEKRRPGTSGRLERNYIRERLGLLARSNWLGSAGKRAAHFAHLEPREPANRNVFAELRDGAVHHLADGLPLVLNVVLFVEAVLFVKFFHFAGD